jgi:hypothetical protein
VLKPSEKRRNRKLARVRVRAEHAIAGIKICRITKDVFRNLADNSSDMVMLIATGLHNFRSARRRFRHKSTDAYFE